MLLAPENNCFRESEQMRMIATWYKALDRRESYKLI